MTRQEFKLLAGVATYREWYKMSVNKKILPASYQIWVGYPLLGNPLSVVCHFEIEQFRLMR